MKTHTMIATKPQGGSFDIKNKDFFDSDSGSDIESMEHVEPVASPVKRSIESIIDCEAENQAKRTKLDQAPTNTIDVSSDTPAGSPQLSNLNVQDDVEDLPMASPIIEIAQDDVEDLPIASITNTDTVETYKKLVKALKVKNEALKVKNEALKVKNEAVLAKCKEENNDLRDRVQEAQEVANDATFKYRDLEKKNNAMCDEYELAINQINKSNNLVFNEMKARLEKTHAQVKSNDKVFNHFNEQLLKARNLAGDTLKGVSTVMKRISKLSTGLGGIHDAHGENTESNAEVIKILDDDREYLGGFSDRLTKFVQFLKTPHSSKSIAEYVRDQYIQ